MRIAHQGKSAPWKRRAMRTIDGVEHWRCSSCSRFLFATEFHRDNRIAHGLKSECKKCHSKNLMKSRDPQNTRRLRRESEARRRARKVGAKGAVSVADMISLDSLWGTVCLRCGARSNLQWDHVQPLARGGAHCISNLQRLCRSCNEQKQARYADYRSDAQKAWVVEVLNGATHDQNDAEQLGRVVREAWVAWAREQPDVSDHPSWLVPWEQLSERDKDVDRRIALAVLAAVNPT